MDTLLEVDNCIGTPSVLEPDDTPSWNDRIEQLEYELFSLPDAITSMPVTNHFAPGVYMREIAMKAGNLYIGHQHITEHYNIVLTGRARVFMNGAIHDVVAPCVMKSGVGVRKVLYIQEDMRWITVHPNPTNETDEDKLGQVFVVRSETHKKCMAEIERINFIKNEVLT